jgi:hypothetical protein
MISWFKPALYIDRIQLYHDHQTTAPAVKCSTKTTTHSMDLSCELVFISRKRNVVL